MFAVIDVETTGLRPGGGDLIVEVAVVRLDDSCNVIDEWTTLVDPERPVGGRHVHGITSRDVHGAPTFGEVVGDLGERLANARLVAHNARFDFAFMEAEYRRLRHDLVFESSCTLQLAERLSFSPSRSLRSCCANLALAHDEGHAALVDAHAAARLFAFLVAAAYERALLLPRPPPLGCDALPALMPSGRQLPRQRPPERSTTSPLCRYVHKLPPAVVPVGADHDAVVPYTELLDRSLEDRRLDPARPWPCANSPAPGASRWSTSPRSTVPA